MKEILPFYHQKVSTTTNPDRWRERVLIVSRCTSLPVRILSSSWPTAIYVVFVWPLPFVSVPFFAASKVLKPLLATPNQMKRQAVVSKPLQSRSHQQQQQQQQTKSFIPTALTTAELQAKKTTSSTAVASSGRSRERNPTHTTPQGRKSVSQTARSNNRAQMSRKSRSGSRSRSRSRSSSPYGRYQPKPLLTGPPEVAFKST